MTLFSFPFLSGSAICGGTIVVCRLDRHAHAHARLPFDIHSYSSHLALLFSLFFSLTTFSARVNLVIRCLLTFIHPLVAKPII